MQGMRTATISRREEMRVYPRQPFNCSVCGHVVKSASTIQAASNSDSRICERCWRLAHDLFRVGPCTVCGQVRLCWDAGGGALVCIDHIGELPPLERVGKCDGCGAVCVLQPADQKRGRFLCVDCEEREECEA